MSAGSALQKKNEQLEAEVIQLSSRVEELSAQVKWFQNQLFGQKSERRIPLSSPDQLYLGQQFQEETAPAETETIKEHQRKKRKTKSEDGDDQKLFFDPEVVPVEDIAIDNPEVEGLAPEEYEVVSQKVSYRLAQKPGVFVILRYTRDVIKKLNPKNGEKKLSCPSLPPEVFEKSHADVSFLAGLLIDKFQYHLPLYRQHQRLQAAGIDVSRAWLTQLVHRCGDLLRPIFDALVETIRLRRVKLIDETPTKARRKKKGKMQTGYFWPALSEKEIVFFFFNSREHRRVFEALGTEPGDDSVIVSDGYEAYKQYAKAVGILNALCWMHARREFVKAEGGAPKQAEEALNLLRPLWQIEKEIEDQGLEGNDKLIHRVLHSKPVVDQFFAWVDKQLKVETLLPSSQLSKALSYVDKRREGLSVFLTDPDVPIDTGELERALRVIPMGRKNWLFCWTEVGAEYVGIFQSLILTCKMHGINPYTYLVDVLQRVQDHPAADIQQLTPGQWKQHFGSKPRCSLIDIVSNSQ